MRLGLLPRAQRLWRRARTLNFRRELAARLYPAGLWDAYSREAATLSAWLDFTAEQVSDSNAVQQRYPGAIDVKSITWFIPDFYNVYYGGIYTLLRFADHFTRRHGVCHSFIVVGTMPERRIRALIVEAFPSLSDAQFRRVGSFDDVPSLPPTDAAIASLWSTAYYLLRFNATKRKFYFMQDYEPLFYPAGSTYAQVEATYRFGFYGIANTPAIKEIYERDYQGVAESFLPCVDTGIFHSDGRRAAGELPYTVFFYGRPGHPRNGFELGAEALRKLKFRLPGRVRIVSAGAEWRPHDFGLEGVVENLGVLGYKQTADLYRQCDAGLVMMFTRHPSYLPFELMASGCLVVTNWNRATSWLLQDGRNCRLAGASASELAGTLERALLNTDERARITQAAACQIRQDFGDWPQQMDNIFRFMQAGR